MATSPAPKICHNLSRKELLEEAISRGEGTLARNGALAVQTGVRTGRSPKDRFIVKDAVTDKAVDWGTINQPISPACFDRLWGLTQNYMNRRDCLFTAELHVGADPTYQIPIHLTCELAWHALFAQDLFISENGLKKSPQPQWEILSAPGFQTIPQRDHVHSDAAILINFTNHRLLICGTHYAGEIKKGMFSVLNFVLPDRNVLPMHCAANQGVHGDVALFFGFIGYRQNDIVHRREAFFDRRR